MDFLAERGVVGASVLEIGGGVGELQVELLLAGASRVTNLELSTNYEEHAARVREQAGVAARVERRLLDIAREPDKVEGADVVVLHRVVCCYPDYERLLGAAGSKAGRLVVFSYPPYNLATRVTQWGANLRRWALRERFRTFVHPPAAMVGVLEQAGFRTTYRWRGFGWFVVGLER